jgi:hypothetical protein
MIDGIFSDEGIFPFPIWDENLSTQQPENIWLRHFSNLMIDSFSDEGIFPFPIWDENLSTQQPEYPKHTWIYLSKPEKMVTGRLPSSPPQAYDEIKNQSTVKNLIKTRQNGDSRFPHRYGVWNNASSPIL